MRRQPDDGSPLTPEPATLAVASSGLSAEISPIGAELRNLRDAAGRSLQWDGDPAVWDGRAPILFPIIGMLAGGRYRLGDRTYAMPKHGIARHARFDVVTHEPASATLRLQADDATREIYPFDFVLDVSFTLVDATLRVVATIANRGDEPMPASFGFHPALRWPLPYGSSRDDHRIRFEHDEPAPIRRIGTDGLLRPEVFPTPVDGDTLVPRDALFVDDALIFDRLTSRRVRYGGIEGPCLEVRLDDFPLLGIWTKPGAGFLCIEPWQGVSDPAGFDGTLWEKPGIIAIPAGDSRELAMSIAVCERPDG